VSNNTFNIGDVITTSWHKVKGAKGIIWTGFFCLIVLHGFGALGSHEYFAKAFGSVAPFWPLMKAVLVIVTLMIEWSLMNIGVMRAYDNPLQFKMLWHGFSLKIFIKMIGLYLLMILIFLPVGLVFALPHLLQYLPLHLDVSQLKIAKAVIYGLGIILIIHLAFRMYIARLFVISQNKNPIYALKASFNYTKSNILKLIGLTIINILIVVVSAIPLGIGLIWTIPYLFISYGVVFAVLTKDNVEPV